MTTNVIQIDDRFRTGRAYAIQDAARLAGVSAGTVRNWLYGYKERQNGDPEPHQAVFGVRAGRRGYEMKPLFGERERPEESEGLSFLELTELIVAASYRKVRIQLSRIQDAHEYARRRWNLPYPFAHLNLRSIGGHLLAEFEREVPGSGGRFVVLSSPDQYLLQPVVEEALTNFDYNAEDQLAERWYPYKREVPVVVDPHVAGGRPIIEGSNVSVDIIQKRWKATVGSDKIARIAADFKLRYADVEAVLQRAV